MDIKDKALLSAAVALTLISEKARFQAARTTDEEAKRSLLETDGHCKVAIRIIQDARKDLEPDKFEAVREAVLLYTATHGTDTK